MKIRLNMKAKELMKIKIYKISKKELVVNW
jgi:hypothetical protein